MLKRLLKRSETSGRDDDNIESIKKRFGELKWSTWGLSLYLHHLARSHVQEHNDAGHRALSETGQGRRGAFEIILDIAFSNTSQYQIDSSPAVEEVHATTVTAVEKVLV